ncbi:MAG TPA: pyridoxamine 5'-phosphate oxidase family protein [Firmicutes bacterium]|jgi:nitroimidazol reductase NimA-like FMN-containing flavoprotein (pyridoxamine 5'-phosphate oxidase superfamily)|nr:pyridoxamine 5'-phosphate oxidase family protein [Bacillota bacterium]
MFREMRKHEKQMQSENIAAVMKRCSCGVLACLGDNGYPYAVPLSFVYFGGKIYFHSAKEGHKIDAITRHPQVSFTVIDKDCVAGGEYTTYFRSVIAFGKAGIVQGEERLKAFRALVEKYCGDQSKAANDRAVAGCTRAVIIAIEIEHLTGKESAE